MRSGWYLRCIILLWIVCNRATLSYKLPRDIENRVGSGEVLSGRDSNALEPSCEQLKAMWRFSKRQSRAAEITNEIPTYRDQFTYNIWEPYYPNSRGNTGLRKKPKHFGTLVRKAPPPALSIHDFGERNRAFDEVARMYGTVQRSNEPQPKSAGLPIRYRNAMTRNGPHIASQSVLTPQIGSFQHLKELIRTERARELQEQRLAEEAATRQIPIKDYFIERQTSYHNQPRYSYTVDTDEIENESQREQADRKPVISFPEMLGQSHLNQYYGGATTYFDDHTYFRPRNHRSSFDISLFDDNFDELLF